MPHFSAATELIERFYDAISERGARRIFLFAPDHNSRVRAPAAAIGDGEIVSRLAATGLFETDGRAFVSEHGVSIHLPRIAKNFPDARVVAVILNAGISGISISEVERALADEIGDDDLIIMSMDLAHDKDAEALAAEDARSIAALIEMDGGAIRRCDVDAKHAAPVALSLMRRSGARRGELIGRVDSNELSGERVARGTSCCAMIFRKKTFCW